MGETRGETGVTDSSTKPEVVSVEEALETVLRVVQRLPPVTVPLHDALGKVLAEDIRARDPLPPYPASIKVTRKKLITVSFEIVHFFE